MLQYSVCQYFVCQTLYVSTLYVTWYIQGAAPAAEHMATHPAVMPPPELGELGGALVALEAGVVPHPVFLVLDLGLRPRPSAVHEAAQPREDGLAGGRGAGLHDSPGEHSAASDKNPLQVKVSLLFYRCPCLLSHYSLIFTDKFYSDMNEKNTVII